MRKIILLILSCVFLTACVSSNDDIVSLDLENEPNDSVICYSDDTYIYSKSVIEYNEDQVATKETYLTIVDYSEFGESYYEIAMESYQSEIELYGIYDGVDIEVVSNDLEITVTYYIDLTLVTEDIVDYIGFDYEDYQIDSTQLINKYEEYGATCVSN